MHRPLAGGNDERLALARELLPGTLGKPIERLFVVEPAEVEGKRCNEHPIAAAGHGRDDFDEEVSEAFVLDPAQIVQEGI